MRKTKNMKVIHTDESRELQLYLENNYDIYQMLEHVYVMLFRKMKKGIYDSEKAIGAFYSVATEAAKKYHEEFGDNFSKWNQIFDVTCRYTVAYTLEKEWRGDNDNF